MTDELQRQLRARISKALSRVPVEEVSDALVIRTPYELHSHESINVFVRRAQDGFLIADGGALSAHYASARSSLDDAPRGFEHLLRWHGCEIIENELTMKTTSDRLVEDAVAYLMALSALAGLAANLSSRPTNPYPGDVRKALEARGYGVGRGEQEVGQLRITWDIAVPSQGIALQCVGGSIAYVPEPAQSARHSIDRLLEVKAYTSLKPFFVVDPDNQWWVPYKPQMERVATLVKSGQDLEELLAQ